MQLCSLSARNFRLIEQLEIEPDPQVTLFWGQNGAGKTSILETVDFLSRGRSFRSRRLDALLRKGARTLTVSGTVHEAGVPTHLGIEKSARGRNLRCNHRKAETLSAHAARLPVVALHPDSHRLVQGGARYRRNYLDWSAFHVKPDFLPAWREYSRCLRQRNQALRQRGSAREIQAWTQKTAVAGERVSLARSSVIEEIKPIFSTFSCKLLPEAESGLRYYRGWPAESQSLEAALAGARSREQRTLATHWGPHRAELALSLNRQPAAQVASRGQQKLLAMSLLLAQAAHLQAHTRRNCAVLLDDIGAELDRDHAQALVREVAALGCQAFMTALAPDDVDLQAWSQARMFHVKQGTCEPSG